MRLKKLFKNYVFCLTLFLCMVTMLSFSNSVLLAQVTVRPGQPSHFKVSAPPSAQAGIEFSLRLEILDIENNRVEDYDQLERTIELTVDGSGELSRSTVSSSDFEDGRLTLSLNYSGAEEIRISVAERDHVAGGRSEEINVRPGPPARFAVDVPSEARAGELFTLGVEARDAHDNRVVRYEQMTNGLIIESSGSDRPTPQFIPAHKFRDGRAFTEISYKTAEEVKFNLIDEVNEIESRTSEIQVLPAGLHEFSVSTPQRVRAGEPFRTAIEARDRYENIIRNYSETGRGIDISSSGEGIISPAFIGPDQFEDGVVFTRLTTTEAESKRIIVQDRSSSADGESERIVVTAGEAADFKISIPEEVRAGEEFTVDITAVDTYGNRVTDYDETGEAVRIAFRGTDLSPEIIPPTSFESGHAEVRLSYESAGKVRLQVEDEPGDIAAQSSNLLVTPGRPGNILIDRPPQVRAGESFSVVFELVDRYGNRIRETNRLGGRIRAAILNHTTEQEKNIRPEAMIDGKTQFSFRHDKAETIGIFAEYDRYDIRERSDYLEVRPGSFHRLAVQSPGTKQAGQFFELGLQLEDKFGNVLDETPGGIAPLQLETTGSGQVVPEQIVPEQISSPRFSVDVRYLVAESMEIEIFDARQRKIGSSAPIRIRPADLDAFDIETPETASADRSFPLRIIARDQYHNLIKNLNTMQGEVAIAADGEQVIEPESIDFREFVNGMAEISAFYHNAEMIHVHARSDDAAGVSEPVTVKPGKPAQFKVDMQQRVRAGIPFPVQLSVFDSYENQLTELPSGFYGARLKASGFERISPDRISAELFEDGVADFYLIYPRSGELELEAEVLADKEELNGVERIFIEREVDSAEIYVVSSSPPDAKFFDKGPGNQVRVDFSAAHLTGDENRHKFDNWFINRIVQSQISERPLPRVRLTIYPRDQVKVSESLQNNLFTLKLERFETE
ncbi:MAG: hypothetical protein ACLFN5_03295, partial [bacterium]